MSEISPHSEALAHLAAEGEKRRNYWYEEFLWLLQQQFVSVARVDNDSLGLQQSLCAEFSLNPWWMKTNRQPERAFAELQTRLGPLLTQGYGLGLDISDIASLVSVPAILDTLCGDIAAKTSGEETLASKLTVSMSAAAAGVPDYLEALQERPNLPVRLAIRLPVAIKNAASQAKQGEAGGGNAFPISHELWHRLLRLSHASTRLSLVPSATTRELSCLHVRERGNSILPSGLFEVPANTAWLNLHLNLHHCFDGSGECKGTHLHRIVRVMLRFADNLIDKARWPWPGLQIDALANRRIAIHLVGIGDLVDRVRQNPASFTTLYKLRGSLTELKTRLLAESASLANQRGVFPEYRVGDLVSRFADRYGVKEARRIVSQHALRHRHLLAISPFDVFPRRKSRFPLADYMNLLPLIFVANTVTARGDAVRHSLTLKQYQRTLQMASAVFANSQ